MFRPSLRSTTRLFHTTGKALKFDLQAEQEIRETINSLPAVNKLYQNTDGTPRTPSDDELKLLSKLTKLGADRKLSILESLTLKKEYESLYLDNQQDLENLIPSYENGASSKIIDKIPYEDATTGTIKWKVVRENQKEGWEKLMYYGFVPSVFLCLAIMLFKPEDGIQDWAEKELRLRAQEKYEGSTENAIASLKDEGKTDAEKKKRDEIIVERILSGEYDRLAGLKLNTPKLPIIDSE